MNIEYIYKYICEAMLTESNVESIKSMFEWIGDVAMQWFLFRSSFFCAIRIWNSLETTHVSTHVSCTRTVAHTPSGIRSMLCEAHKRYT